MKKKYLVVGGVAGGASAAARLRRLDESAEIIMFEKGPDVSFSNCALPYFLGGVIENSEDLVIMHPEEFKNMFNIDARTKQEVLSIDKEKKTVTVKKLTDGSTYEESYDDLILSPGAAPVVPKSIGGWDRDNVFTVRNVVDIKKLNDYIKENNIKKIAVIGGGFIGIEVMENLREAGKEVALIEALDQVMMPFDYEMAQILHKEIYDNGVNLILGDSLKEVKDGKVILSSGKEVMADAVVMAIGVRPETSLATEAGLEIGETGAIKVDNNFRTSDPHIYAVGDAIEVHSFITKKPTRLALAGPAQRQARTVANRIYGKFGSNKGVIGSSIVRVFGMNAASTGLNEKTLIKEGITYDYAFIIPKDKVGIMPDASPLFFKLLFEKPSGRILGAQAIGKGSADKRIDVIATIISMDGTLEDLKELELTYSPIYSTARDVVNIAALVGLNILNGVYKQVPISKTRELVESGAFIIDARPKDMYELGHLKTSINIPIGEFRNRLSEIPKDKPVYIHCRSSQNSYFVLTALQQLGYTNITNISGSFLGISVFEYFNDKTTDREPILTEYNFD
ncbi:MAG: FAD-dependent oxidoreductase [Tissierellia bacterium]|nr:FAD-dependent oxidoreductase [Tissierellia bacterium]